MSASMATTGWPSAARYRVNSADRVVLPLPPLPANAIFDQAERGEVDDAAFLDC